MYMEFELDFMPSYVSSYSQQPELPYVTDLPSTTTQSHMKILAYFSSFTNRPRLVFSSKE